MSTINEAISTYFEPRPAIVSQPKSMSRPPRSPNGAWHIGWKYLTNDMMTNFVTPLEWDTDEAANARLLDTMIEAGCRVQADKAGWSIWDREFNTLISWTQLDPNSNNRKIAIRLAFCKFAKIDPGTGEEGK